MATKTLGTGGDYATFTAAIAGIATWDRLEVITAGTYIETAALSAISKSVEIENVSGGVVKIQTPLGRHIGSVSGGTAVAPVVVTLTGIDFEIRKPGSGGTEYHWLLGGAADANNRLIFNDSTFKSDYTTGNTQVVYQQSGKSHEFRDCTMTGVYDCLVTVGSGICNTSVIDGLTISGSTWSIIHGNTSTDLFGSFDHRRIAGKVTNTPYINGTQASGVSVTTSGLLTTSRLWGMDDPATTLFGTGTIAVEKCVFSGSRQYGFECRGSLSTGTTFRDCEFGGFSGEGVNVSLGSIANLIDYCGASNGCPALSNSAGSVGTHCQISDPLFIDYANHDYHLQAGSPRIDAGTTVIATVDPDGVAIPQGTAPDIGPYEYLAPPPPPPPPLAVEIDGVIRHLTTMDGGSIVSGIQAEIIPTVGDGPLNCIRRMLLVWAGTDKRCLPEELPHGQEDDRRRGWLGDSDLGNRLWLYSRAPLSTAIDDEIRAKTIEDLTWLTDGGFASAYDVTVTHSGRRRDISVFVTAPDGSTATWAIDDLWTVRS